jgi:hypothetical protein
MAYVTPIEFATHFCVDSFITTVTTERYVTAFHNHRQTPCTIFINPQETDKLKRLIVQFLNILRLMLSWHSVIMFTLSKKWPVFYFLFDKTFLLKIVGLLHCILRWVIFRVNDYFLFSLLFVFAVEYSIREIEKMRKDWNCVAYTRSWSMLMILIYWVKT